MKDCLTSGVCATVKMDFVIFYYTTGPSANALALTRFPRDFAYIGGVDPNDYNDEARKAEIPAGFTYRSGGQGNGFLGWKCINTSDGIVPTAAGGTYSMRLKEANGDDPWGGACIAGYKVASDLAAPQCWDGYNLKSPNGRKHLRYRIRHNNSGASVCPDGWWIFPPFQAIIEYSHNGFSDYGTWYLASDRMRMATADCPDETVACDGVSGGNAGHTSLSPCRSTGLDYCGGETMHFDWFGAWSYGTAAAPGAMIKWMVNCTGVKITMGATTLAGNPGACNNSTISPTERMLTNGETSPDPTLSQNPVITFNTFYDDPPSQRFSIRPGSTGDFHIEHGNGHGGMSANDNVPLLEPIDFDLKWIAKAA